MTQKSANLTNEYQNKIGEFQQGRITNTAMANWTSFYLKKFTNQLKEFDQTEAPKELESTKSKMSNSFMNQIKSYELFRDYLLTGNETNNQISTEFLSKSLKDESDAFRSFKNVVNGTMFESLKDLSDSLDGVKLLNT